MGLIFRWTDYGPLIDWANRLAWGAVCGVLVVLAYKIWQVPRDAKKRVDRPFGVR